MIRIKRIYDVYTFNKGNMCNTNNMDSKLHHKMGLNEKRNELGSHNNTHMLTNTSSIIIWTWKKKREIKYLYNNTT